MHARTYAGTCTCKHTDCTKLNLPNLQQAANGDLRRMKTSARNGKHGSFGNRNVFRLHLNESREEREGHSM